MTLFLTRTEFFFKPAFPDTPSAAMGTSLINQPLVDFDWGVLDLSGHQSLVGYLDKAILNDKLRVHAPGL